jgi:uncharacterized protein YaaR (DUF327 family)
VIDFLVRWKNTIKHSVNTVAVGSVAYIHFALPAGSKTGAILAGKAGAGAAAVSATFTGAVAVIATAAAEAVPPVAIGVGVIVVSYEFGKWVKSILPVSVKPFPTGDARSNKRFKNFTCVASGSTENGDMESTWTEEEEEEEEEAMSNKSQKDPKKEKEEKGKDCSECIPQTDEDIKELCDLIQSLRELLDKIRNNGNALLSKKPKYFKKLLHLLTKLIHKHGAVFQRSEAPEARGITLIPFRIDQVRRALVQNPPDLFFDKPIQDFFSTMLTPINNSNASNNSNDSNETSESFKNIKGLIYCIQCQICRGDNQKVFNYVGQTVQLVAKRGTKHYRVIKTQDGHPLHNHLTKKHEIICQNGQINVGILSNAYKIYLVHDLSDNATSPRVAKNCKRETDKRIRRSWEKFYQWIYRAMDFDGGGSRR